MRRTAAALAVISSALLLTACSSPVTTSSSSDAAGSAATPSSASASAAPSSAPSSAPASQSGVATSLDPCQLVTSSEASALAGTTFGAGKEETNGSNGKECVYGSQTTNVFTVEVGQDPDPAAAQADWSKERARAQRLLTKKLPAGISLSVNTQDVSGLGDRAATATGSASAAGQTIGFSGIYLLKGATFVGFQNLLLGHAAPSASALEAQAQKALARVP
jgi:hypothetical protein